MIPFDREFAARSAQQFVDEVLVAALGATQVSIGENFRFGHKAQGDPRLLAADGRFQTRRCTRCWRSTARSSPPATSAASCWPASWPRPTVCSAAPFQLCGEVVHGDERAGASWASRRPTWCPTRRSPVPPRRLRCLATTDREGQAAVSIGVRPTFQTGRGELIEAYLLDFDGDLYGQRLCLEFLERLRGERRLDIYAKTTIVEQMHRDVARTRELVQERGARAVGLC